MFLELTVVALSIVAVVLSLYSIWILWDISEQLND